MLICHIYPLSYILHLLPIVRFIKNEISNITSYNFIYVNCKISAIYLHMLWQPNFYVNLLITYQLLHDL